MNRLATTLTLLCLLLGPALSALAEGSANGTLSPYFWIDGEESSLEQFPLKSTSVDVSVTGVIAAVTVRQTYANLGGAPVSGRYVFPGSTRAAVHGMSMTVADRVVRAVVRERQKARKTFETAKQQGKNASLLEQQRPNVFTMEVANVMPGDTIEVELRYTELLVPDGGTYEFVYPTVVGPRYSSMAAEGAPDTERWVNNPYLRNGGDARQEFSLRVDLAAGLALQEVGSRSHDIEVDFSDDATARIVLSGKDGFGGDRDFVLHYRLAGRAISSGLILQRGAEENFFLLMAEPPERVEPELIPPREYIFVVDVSGSMEGYPLDTAKLLLKDLIGRLRPTDLFNVMLFAGGSKVMAADSVPATPVNVRRATAMIDAGRGGGGTELLQAVDRALMLPAEAGVARTMVVVTDGYVHAERDIFTRIRKNLGDTNVFAFGIGSSVNRHLIEGMARAGGGAPFVVTRPGEARPAAARFIRFVSTPVLTDIGIDFAGFDVYDVEPAASPDLFAEKPIVIIGKWRGEAAGTVTVTGRTGAGDIAASIAVAEAAAPAESGALDYLWARSRVARLLDERAMGEPPGLRDEIVTLGLAYDLLTPFTSFVAVDEIVRNPGGDSTGVTQPLPLPRGVSNLAVGFSVRTVPEPGFVLLALLMLAAAVVLHCRTSRE